MSFSGTSQAAPFVSAAIALVWSLPEFAGKPALIVKNAILNNTHSDAELTGKSITGGVLDLAFVQNSAGVASLPSQRFMQKGEVQLNVPQQAVLVSGRAVSDPVLIDVLKSLAGETVTLRSP